MPHAPRKILPALWVILALALIPSCKKKEAQLSEAPVPTSTVVTIADLKLRIAPNTTAVEIARLTRGEHVKIVQRSADSVHIGKKHAHWYKITNSAGLTGWAYGAGLALESDEGNPAEIQEKIEKKLREVVTGRWEAATAQGKLTPNFVTLFADGKLEFGTNRARTQIGKYKIIFDGPVAQIIIEDIKKPMMSDLKAKMVGETLVFTATMNSTDYKLNLAEKAPSELDKPNNPNGAAAPKP